MSLDAIRTHLSALDARWVEPPVLQPAALYLELVGEDIRRRAFMIQAEGGDDLCLRPDMTVPACRLALWEGLTPTLLAYEGLVFRQQTKDSARETEFVQIGAEWCGVDADPVAIDALVIMTALASVRAFGVEPHARLGDVDLVLAVARACGFSASWTERLARGFRRPGGLSVVLDDAAKADEAPSGGLGAALSAMTPADAERHVLAHLSAQGVQWVGPRSPRDVADRLIAQAHQAALERPGAEAATLVRAALAIDAEPGAALEQIEALLARTPAPKIAAPALAKARDRWRRCRDALPAETRFSPGFGRGLAYYDGFVLELEAADMGPRASLGGGGRYDALLAALAADPHARPTTCPLTAAGFAVRPQRLAAAAEHRS